VITANYKLIGSLVRGPGFTFLLFSGDKEKSLLLALLKEESRKFKTKVLPYCIIDNHFFVIQNTSGKMHDFLMQVDG
jgi:hypothetical protein